MSAIAADLPKPPAAPKKPKEIVTHGDKRVDNYFWLRDKGTPEVTAYLEAENAYADAIMAPTKNLQEALYKEYLSHLKETDDTAPVKRGDYFYYSRTEKGKNYRIYCRKKGGLDAQEQVLLDLNAMSQGLEYFAIGAFEVSDDNRLLAYSTDTNGYRQYTLHIKEIDSGKIRSEKFERVGSVEWAPDNETLFFSTEHDVTKRSDSIHRYKLGEAKPTRIFFEEDENYDTYCTRSRDRKFLFVGSEAKLSTEARFLDLSNPTAELTLIEKRRPDHKYYATHAHGKFWINSNHEAKNYRILTTMPAAPAQSNWREYMAHNPAVKIEGVDPFSKHLVVSEREGGLERIRVIDLATNEPHLITTPEPSYDLSVGENPEFETTTLRFHYQSMVTPASVFDYDMARRDRKLVKQVEVPNYDASQYAAERIFATAKDGTKIPCSVVYKKGFKRDASAPCMLYAYGSYGISMTATFGYTRLPLLDRGFVYVIAHIRGGGELGEPWREAGRMMEKMNTFTDFIACAEHLIKEKYTSRERLAIQGGSAGGLLMGAVINLRPDLFKAVIAQVPFVDVLNTMLDATLPLTTSEYTEWGNPNEKPAYDYMKTYSPYDNIKPQSYPSMLVRTSVNDSQVPYWEAAKWVAKLREQKTDNNLLLLKTNMGAGHGGASGRYDHLKDLAFDHAYLLAQLNVK